jgi:hypothetical protein
MPPSILRLIRNVVVLMRIKGNIKLSPVDHMIWWIFIYKKTGIPKKKVFSAD